MGLEIFILVLLVTSYCGTNMSSMRDKMDPHLMPHGLQRQDLHLMGHTWSFYLVRQYKTESNNVWIFSCSIAWEVLHSTVYIHINIITQLQLHCFLQGKYCWWKICVFISFRVLYLPTPFPKCLNYRTEILYERLCGYKKSTHKLLVTHRPAIGKPRYIQYTHVLHQEVKGITSLQETILE